MCVCECVRVCGCACHMARSRKIIFTCQPKIVRKPLPLPRHPPLNDYATGSATSSACFVVMRAKSHRQSQSQSRNEKWPKMAENLNGVSFEAQKKGARVKRAANKSFKAFSCSDNNVSEKSSN